VSKVEIEEKIVRLRVRIVPASRLVIEHDDTGKSWSGHTWYGNDEYDVMRRMANSLKTFPEYKHATLRVKHEKEEN
jgi:hypothetical protein